MKKKESKELRMAKHLAWNVVGTGKLLDLSSGPETFWRNMAPEIKRYWRTIASEFLQELERYEAE
jgi:hypothetical protein